MTRDRRPERTDSNQWTRETVRAWLGTRRRFLLGTVAVGGAALAGCSEDAPGGTETRAQETDTGGMADGAETEEDIHPDVDVLNYALTLEHLEHAFYRDGLDAFSDEQLSSADPIQRFGDKVRSELPDRIRTVRDHEKGHVKTIETVVEDLGGDPVGEADYTFSYDSATNFLATASVLENTGVAAYKGAAPAIKANEILASALGIHSVEARHAAYLNFVNGKSPHPKAFDSPKSPAEVKEAANPFFSADITGSETTLSPAGEPTADRKAEDDTDDVAVLNFALTLEHLEHAFYRDGLEAFSDSDISDADAIANFSGEVRDAVPDRLRVVRDHEKAHVEAITATVEDLGGDPVGEASYTFEYESPSKFLGIAQVLENTGVAAYAGAGPTVSADPVFVAAAKIHSVEARHAGYLNELNGENPYPAAVDQAKTREEVLEAAGQFIENDG